MNKSTIYYTKQNLFLSSISFFLSYFNIHKAYDFIENETARVMCPQSRKYMLIISIGSSVSWFLLWTLCSLFLFLSLTLFHSFLALWRLKRMFATIQMRTDREKTPSSMNRVCVFLVIQQFIIFFNVCFFLLCFDIVRAFYSKKKI